MKTGRSLLVVGAFFMSFSVVFGQGDYAFKVLANKGTNEVKSGDSWVAVKTGATLQKTDQLKLSENSYIGLVSNAGKPLEVKKSGVHSVTELLAQVQSAANTSVLNKYTDFILSSNSAEAKKNRLSATGAVSRGPKEIKLYLPENNSLADVLNDKVHITWEKDNGPYVVTLKNMFDEQLGVIETPETSIEVSLSAPEYANESAILVEVATKADSKLKSPARLIKKMSPAQADKVKKDMAEFSSQVSEQTALNQFILAGFYEEKKLIIDALGAYEQAIKMAPDVPSYKEAYEEFLFRNKLKKIQTP
ncbi:MAG TPA: hypothetical protein VFE50_19145 [Cyclobacteriaceae bacterium]|nr:hypothetical protein [Cyclobacteriaceae bacterium]